MAIKKSGKSTKGSDEINYIVEEKCGVISERGHGYKLELRYVAWNENEPRYDIRPWKETDEGERCGKGITLTGEELEELGKLINKLAKGK